MRIAVAGSFVVDTVVRGGTATKALGGIAYNIRGLLSAAPDWDIVPIAGVDPEAQELFQEEFGEEARVSQEGLFPAKAGAHRNKITLNGIQRTEEFSPGRCGLDMERFRGLNEVEALIINMITPWDMTLETARGLAARFRGHLHLDVHSLVRDVGPEGLWVPVSRDYHGWMAVPDTLQMNMEEAQAFTGFPVAHPEDARRLAMITVLAGPRTCVITLGPRGAALAWRDEDGVRSALTAPARVGNIDPPGAGDMFSSWFVKEMAGGKPPDLAVKTAVQKASEFVAQEEESYGHERG